MLRVGTMTIPCLLGGVAHAAWAASGNQAAHDVHDIHFCESTVTASLPLYTRRHFAQAFALAFLVNILLPVDRNPIVVERALAKYGTVFSNFCWPHVMGNMRWNPLFGQNQARVK